MQDPPASRMTHNNSWLFCGALLGGLSVTLGSFGAHWLKAHLEKIHQTDNWETAVRYCLFHAIVLLIVGIAHQIESFANVRVWLSRAGWCFLFGTLLFSGCLAVLALSGIKILGAVVPIGGGLLIAGWLCMAYVGWSHKTT